MKVKIRISFFLILCLFTHFIYAAVIKKHGSIEIDGKSYQTNFIQGSLDEKNDLTILGFSIEKSLMNDVVNKLGQVAASTKGQTAFLDKSLCYVNANKIGVKFHSGEMTNEKLVESIEVFDPNFSNIAKCLRVENSVLPSELHNNRGIRLGITQKNIFALLGKPSLKLRNDTQWHYIYESVLPSLRCKDGFDVLGSYDLYFKHNKLIRFVISKTTSC